MTNENDGRQKDDCRLTDVFVARSAGHPSDITPTDCFRMHRVIWQEMRISEDGERLICRFLAPDAESVRIALRLSGIRFDSVWTNDRNADTC